MSLVSLPSRPRSLVSGSLLVVLLIAALAMPGPAAAQRASEKVEIPAPETVALDFTDLPRMDRIRLKATYYPGVAAQDRGKEIVPVILLHGFKGNRNDMRGLAEYLQQLTDEQGEPIGHAVIVPDLRGHGESAVQDGVPLDPDRMRPDQAQAMVRGDLEEVKRFLMRRNNAGELNIEKLCVVGADMGAVIALHWAALDWSWPMAGSTKQGRDVKALVLISPQRDFKGLNAFRALESPAVSRELSIHIVVGRGNSRDYSTASSLFRRLERFHPEPPPEQILEKKDLFLDEYETSLSGTRMLGANLGLEERIARFIELRLVNQDYPWQERHAPVSP